MPNARCGVWEAFTFTFLYSYVKLECGPMLNVMAALPNIGGALSLCSTPESLADAHYQNVVQ